MVYALVNAITKFREQVVLETLLGAPLRTIVAPFAARMLITMSSAYVLFLIASLLTFQRLNERYMLLVAD
jgi:hypothetical protein